jgi:hypothetical protein
MPVTAIFTAGPACCWLEMVCRVGGFFGMQSRAVARGGINAAEKEKLHRLEQSDHFSQVKKWSVFFNGNGGAGRE